MKEKKLFNSIEGMDNKFVNEALETMKKNIYNEENEVFVSPVEVEKSEAKRTIKPLLIKGGSLAAGMCAVLAAVVAINSFGRGAELILANAGSDEGAEISDSADVSDSGFVDAPISEETTAELEEIIIDTPISGLPEATTPVYAAIDEYFTTEKLKLSDCVLGFGLCEHLITDDKIYNAEIAVTGKKMELTCYEIDTGAMDVIYTETSEEYIYNDYLPICEYNGYLYMQRSVEDKRDSAENEELFTILRINLSDRSVETVVENILFDKWAEPNTLCFGNIIYIEKKGEGINSYYIDAYNMDTGEISLFKDQARHPQVYKNSIIYLTYGAMYMCDAVTGENDKKICDINFEMDRESCGEAEIYSDGESLFRFTYQKSPDDDPVLKGNYYFTIDEFNGEEFEPKAIFVGYVDNCHVQSANGLIAVSAQLPSFSHRSVGIIYDKNSGEFFRIDKEDKDISFYSSDNRLFYVENIYDAVEEICHLTGDCYFELIKK